MAGDGGGGGDVVVVVVVDFSSRARILDDCSTVKFPACALSGD